jgi:hypothetical protein
VICYRRTRDAFVGSLETGEPARGPSRSGMPNVQGAAQCGRGARWEYRPALLPVLRTRSEWRATITVPLRDRFHGLEGATSGIARQWRSVNSSEGSTPSAGSRQLSLGPSTVLT